MKKKWNQIVIIYENLIFPSFRNIHKNHILDITRLPSRTAKQTEELAVEYTIKILKKLEYIGIICIEFFIDASGNLRERKIL